MVAVNHPFEGCAPAPRRSNLRCINRSLKLALDVLLGAVVPILVLSYLSGPLGAVPAYLISVAIRTSSRAADFVLASRLKKFEMLSRFSGLA